MNNDDIEIDVQAVLGDAGRQIAQLSIDLAVERAKVAALQKQIEEMKNPPPTTAL